MAVMRLWLRQIGGELRKLQGQRRVRMSFGVCVFVEIIYALLFKLPGVRAVTEGDFTRHHVDFHEAFSGPTIAAHLLGDASTLVGVIAIAMVAGEIVSREVEDGTLRMVLCRPVSRRRIWVQRLLVASAYSIVFSAFIAGSALVVGLAFEGPGHLLMIKTFENVVGEFSFADGLIRYAIAAALLSVSMLTATFLAFALSCSHCKPATIAAVTLTILWTDRALRRLPALATVKDHFLMAHMLSWLHAFDDTIAWGLIREHFTWLLAIDLVLIAASYAAFHRLELKP